jgi:hypothetical protein
MAGVIPSLTSRTQCIHRGAKERRGTDASLTAFLLELAVKFSGLPPMPVEQLPPLQAISRGQMKALASAANNAVAAGRYLARQP